MRVLAIIPTYNESDILPAVLTHLHAQGVDTYVIDNWSTDETWDMIRACAYHDSDLVVGGERFPVHPVHVYQWERILRRVEEVALEYSNQYDWMMLHDADEIRRSPSRWVTDWGIGGPLSDYDSRNHTLVDGIAMANRLSYNVIDFKVFTFPPIDNGFIPGNNPETYFTKYRRESGYERVSQEKCWKVIPGLPVDLASSGGHRVVFRGMSIPPSLIAKRVCPHKFILKHYPIRSQVHGERKVFEERKKRWHLGERNKNWHTQYDGVKEGDSFLADPGELIDYE